jgi:acetyl-CoA synthetase
MYVALKPGYHASEELAKKINDALVREIGPIAKARKVWIVS